MSTSGSKSNEHVAHFLVDIHTAREYSVTIQLMKKCPKVATTKS